LIVKKKNVKCPASIDIAASTRLDLRQTRSGLMNDQNVERENLVGLEGLEPSTRPL